MSGGPAQNQILNTGRDRDRIELKPYILAENQRRRTEMYRMLFEIASKNISTPLEEMRVSINAALCEIGRFMSADRAYVFEYEFEHNIAVTTNAWCRKGLQAPVEGKRFRALDTVADWIDLHLEGKPVIINDVPGIPASPLRDLLIDRGIKSVIAVPIFIEERLIGFSGFDSLQKHRYFKVSDVDLIDYFGQILVSLKLRIQAENNMRKTMNDLEVQVEERAAELLKLKVALKRKTIEYDEINTAIRVLLDNQMAQF